MCSTHRCSTNSRKIEKAFLGRSEGSESCVTANKNKGKTPNSFNQQLSSLNLKDFSKLAHSVASLKCVTCLLQQVDD